MPITRSSVFKLLLTPEKAALVAGPRPHCASSSASKEAAFASRSMNSWLSLRDEPTCGAQEAPSVPAFLRRKSGRGEREAQVLSDRDFRIWWHSQIA